MSTPAENRSPRVEILKSVHRIMKSHPLHFHGLSILFFLPIIFTLIIYPSFHLALFHPDYNFHQLDYHYLPLSSFEIVLPILYTLCLSLFYLCAVATITHSAAQALCDKPINLLSSVKSIRNSFFPLLSTFILSHIILISIALFFVILVVFLVQILRSIGLIELKYDLNHFLYLCFFSLIVLVPILAWLQVNWLLAYVIAVVESKSCFEALRRSANLLKVKRWMAWCTMLSYGLSMGPSVVAHSISSVMVGVTLGSLLAIVVVVAGSFLMNHYLLENVALYMYCKDEFFNGEKSPLEIGHKVTGASFETFVGGNLGVPLSEAGFRSSNRRPLEVAVVEVSSYQLEIPPKYFCPSVAVILNLTPDHLERHQTMKNYAAIKCRIFSHMRGNKIGILPLGNPYLDEAVMDHADGVSLAWIGGSPGVNVDVEAKIAELKLPTLGCVSQLQLSELKAVGKHNYTNAAVAALSVLGLDIEIKAEAFSSTISKLTTLPHRMQVVYVDDDGIVYVDDSKATNVEATYFGLIGFELKSVVLLGGVAKEVKMKGSNGFEQLVEPFRHHRGVITFGFSGKMIQKTLCANGLTIPCLNAETLKDAVSLARSIAQRGDAIVLSPGCASFDEFRNFEHRGRIFQELAISSE